MKGVLFLKEKGLNQKAAEKKGAAHCTKGGGGVKGEKNI